VNAEQRKILSIGKPIWGVTVRIVDENDAPLPPGDSNVGELVIRGHNIMKGYYKNPEATAAGFSNGWFHTGDLGYADEDRFFFSVDRKKDLVIRGGYNVYRREVEEVLYAHAAVAEAAVIGRPDPGAGPGGRRLRPAQGGRHRGPRRAGVVLQGAAGGLQVPPRGAHRRRAAEGRHRQDLEEGAARLNGPSAAGPRRAAGHR
jgi:acyl-CoA synthetase (AMP-forming)/AMP-acid ligase II